MNNDTLTLKQAVIMIFLLMIGIGSVFLPGLEAQADIWLAVLIALAAGYIMSMLYTRILSILPGKDFFETVEFFVGKTGAGIVFFMMACFGLGLGAVILAGTGHFAVTISLQETPLTVVLLMTTLVCAFLIRHGIETLGKWVRLIVMVNILFIGFALLASFGYQDFSNLQPILYNGIGPVLKGAFHCLCFPLSEIVVFLLVFPALQKKNSPRRVFSIGYLFGGLTFFIITVAVALVLGFDSVKPPMYATYKALSVVHLGDFITRLEVIGIPPLIISLLFNISILLLGASRGISRALGFDDYRFIVFPMALLMLGCAMFFFNNALLLHTWFYTVFPYIAFVFEIPIPLILLLIIEIKYRRLKAANRIPPG